MDEEINRIWWWGVATGGNISGLLNEDGVQLLQNEDGSQIILNENA